MPGETREPPPFRPDLPRWPGGSLLGRLGTADRTELLALGQEREFAAGARLLTQGDRSLFVMIILTGNVKVTIDTADGRVTLLAVRIAGDLIGELACLDEEQPRMATVTAAGAVRARLISGEHFRAFLNRHPDAAMIVSSVVASKLRWTTRRRVDVGTCPVPVRLARVLIDLADSHGERSDDGIELGFTLTQPELAALIGASEPAVHRALTDLRHLGIMATKYRQTVIRDLTALRQQAMPDD